MGRLDALLQSHVEGGTAPGAVAPGLHRGRLVCLRRMLLAEGSRSGTIPLLSAPSIARLTTNRLTANRLTLDQRRASGLFLVVQGWGFGGSVDVEAVDPWVVPGRYGWVGGTGTSAHVTPSTRTTAILMTQLEMPGRSPPR